MAGTYNLCNQRGRDEFFHEVETDKGRQRDFLSTEDYDDLRIVIEIGWDVKGLTKKGRKKASIGYRTFYKLSSLKRFLGIGHNGYTPYTDPMVDWSKRGLCKYKKRAHLSVGTVRSGRLISETIIKRYRLES